MAAQGRKQQVESAEEQQDLSSFPGGGALGGVWWTGHAPSSHPCAREEPRALIKQHFWRLARCQPSPSVIPLVFGTCSFAGEKTKAQRGRGWLGGPAQRGLRAGGAGAAEQVRGGVEQGHSAWFPWQPRLPTATLARDT